MPHEPHCPDLSPCDFSSSHDWNEHWKPSFCWHSGNSEGRDKQLCSIVESATQDCLKDHQKRRKWRIDADGGCFEGYSLYQSVSTPSVLEYSGDTFYYDCAFAGFLYSWFQAFAVFCMLYAIFWVIKLRLEFICRRFGTLFHLHRQVDVNRMN